ncbi:hypothetical protein V3W47_19040 [Deinococcus sp. YIM 134068]|uniref:hypothetical protein n=1 Tax=Deinococcus lichenicola TaxID=3118910 RepID=UPI002F92C406
MKRAPEQTAPALIRTGVYTALGGALLAGAVGLVVVALNPPPKVASSSAGGCGCGCSGTTSAAAKAAKVYG